MPIHPHVRQQLAAGLASAAARYDLGDSDRALRAEAARSMDAWWRDAAGLNDGPIDLIDMFSGCGGMSAGFRAVNGVLPAFRQILAIDIDEAANETLEANLGLKPAKQDIHALAENLDLVDRLVESSGRRPDAPLVLIGCAPCQGFSSHRNSSGMTDSRNSLFVDFAKIAAHLNPDFVIAENVPEILTDRYWPVVLEAKKVLESAGYHVQVSVHNVAEYGVPQERFRALMMASKMPFTSVDGVLDRSEFRTVRDAIGMLPEIEPGTSDPNDKMHVSASHRESTLATIRSIPADGGNRPADSGPNSLRSLHLRQGKAAFEDVYGRLAWERPSITITAYSRNPASGRFVHPEQHRGLSVREAALLQSFPRSYTFEGSFDGKFRQIGNAVPPVFATSIALSIVQQMASPPESFPVNSIRASLGKSFSRLIPSLKAGSQRLLKANSAITEESA